MITTISLNPSVDRRYMVADFENGRVHRTNRYEATAGGKGLNVTRVVSALGEKVLATGLLGGKSGEFIEQELDRIGIANQFLKINGETRSCIAILTENGEQTEILESGPTLSAEDLKRFVSHYVMILEESSVIVASGSVPPGMPVTYYKHLIQLAKEKKIPFLLDTSGSALQEGIKAGPTLIKPNLEELEALVGKPLKSEEEVIDAGKLLSQNSIEYVLISLGGDGSILIHDGAVYRVRLPKVTIKNPVGSGDSMVAGFAVGLLRGYDITQTLKLASAAGTANAMEEGTGSVDSEKVAALFDEVEVKKIVI